MVWAGVGGDDGGSQMIGYVTGVGQSFVVCAFLPYKIPTDGSTVGGGGGSSGGSGGGSGVDV